METKATSLESAKELHNILQQYQQSHPLRQPTTIQNCELKGHQIQGLEWFASLHKNNLNGILGDEMGLGKTLQSIAFMAYLKETENVDGPFLVVCPLSLISSWITEIAKFCPSFKTMKYAGAKEERALFQSQVSTHISSLPEEKQDDPSLFFDVLVTTYEMLLADSRFLSGIKWKALFIDEAHRLKNSKSKLYTTLEENHMHQRCYLLTGMPIQSNLEELWTLLHLIAPGQFNDKSQFESWFSGEENLKDLQDIVRPYLLRRTQSTIRQA